ncbi:MAG: hypothetical protein Q9208_007508 [Pyrenodesmia sp. 3 TL-2023]
MRPLTSAELQQALTKRPFLLLNVAILPLRYAIQLFLANRLPGPAGNLPAELWLNIADQYTRLCPPDHEAVQAVSLKSSTLGQVLECRGFKLQLGTLDSKPTVEAAEDYLGDPARFCNRKKPFWGDGDQDEVGYGFNAKATCLAYTLVFPGVNAAECGMVGEPAAAVIELSSTPASSTTTSGSPALLLPDCLFVDITVPDVLAFLEGGRCWLCRAHEHDGSRYISPRAVWEEAERFGCSTVTLALACPLCIGMDVMAEDEKNVQKYLYEPTPSVQHAARKARHRKRYAELGYEYKDPMYLTNFGAAFGSKLLESNDGCGSIERIATTHSTITSSTCSYGLILSRNIGHGMLPNPRSNMKPTVTGFGSAGVVYRVTFKIAAKRPLRDSDSDNEGFRNEYHIYHLLSDHQPNFNILQSFYRISNANSLHYLSGRNPRCPTPEPTEERS